MAQYETRVHFHTLQQIAIEQKFENPEIKIKTITPERAGSAPHLFHGTILEKNGDVLHMFIKVATIGEQAKPVPETTYYSREIFMYLELVNKYKLLEERQHLVEEHRLKLPNFYASSTYLPTCIPDYFEEVLVLENLSDKGYMTFNRYTSVDWPFAAGAIKELAKLHALSMAYEDENPQEFEKILRDLQTCDVHKEVPFTWDMLFKRAVLKALSVVREENKSKLTEKLETTDFGYHSRFTTSSKRRVIIHGDFRPKNMMYKEKNDSSVEVIPVDYQNLRGACPVVDLLYFIFTGTDQQFRARYYKQLVDYYYSELRAALLRLGLDPEEKYSRADFDEELKEKLPYGLGVAVFALPIVAVEADHAPVVDENMDLGSLSTVKTGSLYSERLNGVVDDFVRWGVL